MPSNLNRSGSSSVEPELIASNASWLEASSSRT
ncbi:Uncharacterised protein [Mycobacteroides abscessus]|nr:Uncharacterised protein [Mycobacteroides abscessus]